MDRRTFCVHLLSGLAISALPGRVGASEPGSTGIRWHSDLRAAQKLATQQNKPMLIVFGASWCTFCHKMERDTLSDPKIVELIGSDFIPVHLDLDREKQVARILEVTSIPCTVVLSPEADLLGRSVGYMKADPYHRMLQESRQLQQEIRQTKFAQQP